MHNVLAYVAVIAVGAAVTLVANVPARKISLRIGYTAAPDERKVHQVTTPYGGGAAMLVGFCVALIVSMAIPTLRNVILSSHEMIGVLLAAGVIFVVGVLDDFREMSAPAKVAGQFLAASILYFSGATMYQLKLPFAGFVVLGPSILPIITAVWVFALSNAVNLIDGLDGLAGGIVAIASGTLCLYGLRLEDLGLLPSNNVGPLIAALTCGICLGFLKDNFHPAKLFMGDAGALMLGLLMSASTMVIGGRTPPASGVTFFFFAPLLIPVFILGVPLIDAVWAFVRRTVSGQGFHTPDKNHIHHRLMRLGHGHRRTVVILWLWTALLCGFVLLPLFDTKANVFIPLGVALLLIGLMTWFSPLVNRLYYRVEEAKHVREKLTPVSNDGGDHEPSTPPEQDNDSVKDLPGVVAFLTMGTTVAIIIAIFVVLGLWADHEWGTAPWGLLIGIALGTVAAVVSVVKQVRRFL